uniref:Reverse transcriptase domain-containing protein n=1 Tax=Leptobrachium leishanense TaxID=445787 RepID=A0A8C5QNH5_9ANUR
MQPNTMMALSLNVKGLNSPQKRRVLFRDLRRKHVDIAFLQETRIPRQDSHRLRDPRFSQVFSSCALNKQNGVAILIHRNCLFTKHDVHTDTAGRYVILSGTLGTRSVTLVNVYAPNTPDKHFWEALQADLDRHALGEILMCGDFNAVPCPAVDRSRPSANQTPTMGTRQDVLFGSFLNQRALIDVWRVSHPSTKDFTFYSNPHGSYSRIDNILISPSLLPWVTAASIGVISWSDHANVVMELSLPNCSPAWNWRLGSHTLQDAGLVRELEGELEAYFRDNVTGDISFSTVWAAHKAVIRGEIIKKVSYRKRLKLQSVLELQHTLRVQELEHKTTPSQEGFDRLQGTRHALNRLLLEDVAKAMTWSKRRFYESANKMDTLLARQIRPRPPVTRITSLKDSAGRSIKSPQNIKRAFTDYYSSLYNHSPLHSPPTASHLTEINSFLSSVDLPKLSSSQGLALAKDFTLEEISEAIVSLKPNKAPGPDGYTARYYKTFFPILGPHLVTLFNAVKAGNPFPPDSLLASLVVLPKPGKNLSDPSGYRPISLLNLDVKIYAKVLAARLNPLLPSIIHPDQVGFIQGRQAYENTRRAVGAIWHLEREGRPSLLLSLDAEKAFDRIEWPFLFTLLEHMSFPPEFCSAIRALYHNPRADVSIPGSQAAPFSIHNGTRQGCPLSPLLFALTLEPLLTHIRSSPDIKGMTVQDGSFKVSAYADDVLLTLTSPESSLTATSALLSRFSAVSGFRVNLDKSVILPFHLSRHQTQALTAVFGFKIASTTIPYLGIHLPNKHDDIYKVNYPPLYAKLRGEMEVWNKECISWLGRVHCIKMNLLPRLLYLFQALPSPIDPSDLRFLQSHIDAFVWRGGRRRVARSTLYRPRELGGLGLPNIQCYFQAAQLSQVVTLHSPPNTHRWVDFESACMFPESPKYWMWLPKNVRPKVPTLCPPLSHSIALWDSLASSKKLRQASSSMLPIWRNPLFPPGQAPDQFSRFVEGGILRIRDLQDRAGLYSFDSLTARSGLHPQDFFRYMQLHHFASTTENKIAGSSSLTFFERLCLSGDPPRGLISRLYAHMVSTPSLPIITYMAAWERDLGSTLEGDEWLDIWEAARKVSICTTLQEQGLKTMMRWYTTPVLLHKTNSAVPDDCWRGCGERGTQAHMWWSCPAISKYWDSVQTLLEQVFGTRVPKDPWTYLFANPVPDFTMHHNRLLSKILLAARKAVAESWRSPRLPPQRRLLQIMDHIQLMDELSAKVHHTMPAYRKVWDAWESLGM